MRLESLHEAHAPNRHRQIHISCPSNTKTRQHNSHCFPFPSQLEAYENDAHGGFLVGKEVKERIQRLLGWLWEATPFAHGVGIFCAGDDPHAD